MEKTNYTEIIKSARRQKGMTQQELAEETGLSTRTIQRIERGADEISGFSLKQISKVLDIPLENLIMQNVNQISIDSNQTGSIKNLYLFSLAFLVNPIFGVVVPGIIGFSKQNRTYVYNKHLYKILKIQSIAFVIGIIIMILLLFKILHYQLPSFLNSIVNFQTLIFIIPVYYSLILIFIVYNIYRLKDKKTVHEK